VEAPISRSGDAKAFPGSISGYSTPCRSRFELGRRHPSEKVLVEIARVRRDGTQRGVIDTMQTCAELYDRIDYHTYEQRLDVLFAQKKPSR